MSKHEYLKTIKCRFSRYQ